MSGNGGCQAVNRGRVACDTGRTSQTIQTLRSAGNSFQAIPRALNDAGPARGGAVCSGILNAVAKILLAQGNHSR
jgi:hypothetical protein